MSSRDSNGDEEREQDGQGDDTSQSGADEPVADDMVQFQIPGTSRETIPLHELHAIIEYALQAEQATPSSSSDTEAHQQIPTPANVSEGASLPTSSASTADQPTTAENSPAVVVQPPAVRQENHRPVAAVQPQPAYNLANIYGQGILNRGPIPPPRQVVARGAQSAAAYVPISYILMGDEPGMTETRRQAYADSLDQIRQMYRQVPQGNPPLPPDREAPQGNPPQPPSREAPQGNPPPPPEREATCCMQLVAASSGSSLPQQGVASVPEQHTYSSVPAGSPVPARAQQREVTQPPGPSEQNVRPPTTSDTKEPGASSQTTFGAHTSTPHCSLPTEGDNILTPANETKSIVDDYPETNAPTLNPEQLQQSYYVVQEDLAPSSDDDMTSEAGAKSSIAQPSGEDQTHATICLLLEGIQEEQNTNEEPELRLHEQVLAVHASSQIPHALMSPSDVLLVAQASEAVHQEINAADGHRADYPTCTSLPQQQLNTVGNAGSTSDFTKANGISTQDESTQVNIELEQQGDSAIHNPSKSQRADTASYNNPATSSQILSRAGDTPEMMQTESSFSSLGQSKEEAEGTDKQLALHPNLQRILTAGTAYSGGVLTNDVVMQRSEATGDPAGTRGQDHTNGESPLPRGTKATLRPGGTSGVAQSCVVGTGGGRAATAHGQQSFINMTPRGGQKRHSDPNEVSSPTAKKPAVVSLGTEFQCVPSSTTFLLQQEDSKPLSAIQETAVDTLGSGALSLAEHILTHPEETALNCEPLKSFKRIVDIRPLNKEKENEVTSDYRQETVLTESVSTVQNINCEHEQDYHSNNSVVELVSQNATEQHSDEIMAIPQQLHGESSDYKKAKSYAGYVTLDNEDRHLELHETGTQAAQVQDEGESGNVCNATDIPGRQQVAEEHVNDCPPGEPHSDERQSISGEHEIQTEEVNDSGSSVAQDVVRLSYPIQGLRRIIFEIKLECIIIRDRHYSTTVGPSTSDGTPMVQTGQSSNGHGITVEHALSVQTQCAEGRNTSYVQAVGSVGNRYEVVGTRRNISNKTSSEAPLTWKVSIEIGQEGVTAENSVIHLLIKQRLGDNDFHQESDNPPEERENTCGPVGREDSSSSGMVTWHAQEGNVGNDTDCNVITGNETSTVDVVATTEHNEEELNEDERNSPSEDIDSMSSNFSDDDVVFNSFGEELGGKNITL